jgi:phospholipase/lecithinase/hemolysin
MCRWLSVAWLCLPLTLFATPVKSIVIFGDSLSDTGNTTHLLKSLKQDENPSYLVNPFKVFVINKMIEFADDYYVPQIVLDSGIEIVTNFFDHDLAPLLVSIISKVRKVPVLPGDPYWQSHFSNGRVWNEYLAPMLNVDREDIKHFTNQAFGGSWAQTYDYQLTTWNLIRHPIETLKTLVVGKLIPPSLGITIQTYLLNNKLDSNTAYFVFAGANDYLNVLHFEDNYNPAVMNDYVDNVIGSLESAVQKLTQSGAKHVIVLGLPSVGYTPKFVNSYDKEILNQAVAWHNQRLAEKVSEWQYESPDVDFLFINVQDFLRNAVENPQKFGLTNVKEACIDVKLPMFHAFANSPFAGNFVLLYAQVLQYRDKSFADNEKNYHICDTPDSYLFWDEVHPSTRAHKRLAYDICQAMKAHGYDATCQEPKDI